MFKRKIYKSLSVALAAAMLSTVLTPISSMAEVETRKELPELAVANEETAGSVVGFAGQQWWVIGDDDEGVYQQPDGITLLVRGGNPYGTITFRKAENMDFVTVEKEYKGSDVHKKMEELAADGLSFPAKELGSINARTLTAADDNTNPMAGEDVANQALWLLSYDEYDVVGNVQVRAFDTGWWLRSGAATRANRAYASDAGGMGLMEFGVKVDYYSLRPALSLNLSSVVFASDADGENAKPAAVGETLTALTQDGEAVKFTMQDAAQTLDVAPESLEGSTPSFTYSNATVGANQYVSALLENIDSGETYYGKLVEVGENADSASGELILPLSGLADGNYEVQIFSEESNGDNYTDFVSEAYTTALEVKDGKVAETLPEKDGWVEEDGKMYFYENDVMKTGWQTIEGKTYYFKMSGDKKGVMFTGMQSIGGKRYYFAPSGAAGVKGSLATGWTKISSRIYYFKMTGAPGVKGVMLKGWQTIGGKSYYFKQTGSLEGVMLRGWQSIGGKRYYFKQTGNSPEIGRMFTGWQTIGGKQYFLKRTGVKGIKGVMLTGLQRIDGKQYFFSKNKATYGQVLKNQWVKVGNRSYYVSGNGAVTKTR